MSKNRMKKLVSVLLALTMTVLCFVPAAAAEPKDKVTPILIIAGFSEYALVDGDGNQVWGPSQDAIVEAAKNAIAPLGAFLKGDYETFCTGIVEIANAADCAGSRWGPESRGSAAIYLRTAANCRPSACGLPPMPRRA